MSSLVSDVILKLVSPSISRTIFNWKGICEYKIVMDFGMRVGEFEFRIIDLFISKLNFWLFFKALCLVSPLIFFVRFYRNDNIGHHPPDHNEYHLQPAPTQQQCQRTHPPTPATPDTQHPPAHPVLRIRERDSNRHFPPYRRHHHHHHHQQHPVQRAHLRRSPLRPHRTSARHRQHSHDQSTPTHSTHRHRPASASTPRQPATHSSTHRHSAHHHDGRSHDTDDGSGGRSEVWSGRSVVSAGAGLLAGDWLRSAARCTQWTEGTARTGCSRECATLASGWSAAAAAVLVKRPNDVLSFYWATWFLDLSDCHVWLIFFLSTSSSFSNPFHYSGFRPLSVFYSGRPLFFFFLSALRIDDHFGCVWGTWLTGLALLFPSLVAVAHIFMGVL